MALARAPIPSPNYRAGRSSSRLVVIHTSEGATTYQNLGNFLAQPSSQVSYQVGWDDYTANTVGEYVAHPDTCWAAMNANSWGEHGCCCTPSGASQGWSRDTWTSKRTMLGNCAAWIAEECARYQIPIAKISAGDITAGRAGVCGHADCSAAGAGGSHTDPGPNFPWDQVIAMAAGGVAPPAPGPAPQAQEDNMVLQDPATGGYWIADRTGAVYSYDAAPYLGGVNNPKFNAKNLPCVGIARWNDNKGEGYTLVLDWGPDKGGGKSAIDGGDVYRRYRFPRDGSGAA